MTPELRRVGLCAAMKILGLTGSVGMGKSTAAAMLRRMGMPVYDADRAVHRVLGTGRRRGRARCRGHFPASRATAGSIAGAGRAGLRRPGRARLEAILHPLVAPPNAGSSPWRGRARRRLVVLDVPLLYESGASERCDLVLVVWAPSFLQRVRVLKRPGMTALRLAFIRAQQTSDREKRRRADFLVPSGLGRAVTWRRLARVRREIGAGGG